MLYTANTLHRWQRLWIYTHQDTFCSRARWPCRRALKTWRGTWWKTSLRSHLRTSDLPGKSWCAMSQVACVVWAVYVRFRFYGALCVNVSVTFSSCARYYDWLCVWRCAMCVKRFVIYLSVCIYIYTCTYIYIGIHIYVYIHTDLYTYIYIMRYVCGAKREYISTIAIWIYGVHASISQGK